MDIIQSKENSIIVETKKLKERKYRSKEKKFIVEGFRFVIEALQSDFHVPIVLISESQKERYEKFLIENKLQQLTKVYWVKDSIFNSLCFTDTPQGILAVVAKKEVEILNEKGFYVFVNGVQDPGNLGTIIRTADAAGSLGVILSKGTVDAFNDKTLRSTMGSIFHIPVVEAEDLNIINKLASNGFRLAVSSLDGNNDIFHEKLSEKVIFVIGNEGAGVEKEIQDMADIKVKIPMLGNAESLNAAVAAAILMYEYVRQIKQ